MRQIDTFRISHMHHVQLPQQGDDTLSQWFLGWKILLGFTTTTFWLDIFWHWAYQPSLWLFLHLSEIDNFYIKLWATSQDVVASSHTWPEPEWTQSVNAHGLPNKLPLRSPEVLGHCFRLSLLSKSRVDRLKVCQKAGVSSGSKK